MYEHSLAGKEIIPIQAQCVAVMNMGGVPQWQAEKWLREGFQDAEVGLVIHKPKGNFCNPRRPLFDLDPVELVNIHLR